ncbi:unnamed protein product, partial [Mesorhabditis spiculigera]
FRAALMTNLHSVMDISSGLFNGTLLYLIIFCTTKSFRNYSIILGCTTLTEFVLGLSAGFTMTRTIPVEYTLVYQFHGLCRKLSAQICMDAHAVIVHCFAYNYTLLPLSFWYRHRVLTNGLCSPLRVTLYCFILYIPAFLVMVCFAAGTSPPEIIHKILAAKKNGSLYPDDPNIAALIGYEDMTTYYNIAITMWICAPIMPGYTISIYYRYQILQKLKMDRGMSAKTLKAQENLVKALTLQMITPLLSMSQSSAFVWIQYQLPGHKHIFFLEELVFILVAMTSMLNPCITIYYVLPYRKELQKLLCFWRRKQDFSRRIYSEAKNSHTKDSKLQHTNELF